ncbi:MAG: arginine-tRNA-protein transferase [Leptospiraceae bacterium]|nr:arginine-tRNA-protein transferase [Leptospiraceae bacterium]
MILPKKFLSNQMSPENLDFLLSRGYRHFGSFFYRYRFSFHQGKRTRVLPLRIHLNKYNPKKDHKKILKKNEGLEYCFLPSFIDEEREIMFDLHKKRFRENIPDSLYTFLSFSPATIPCENMQCNVIKDGKLIAVSYLDIGMESISSVYGMFLPEFSHLHPGIFTMLLEIEYAIKNGKKYYYHGYAYESESFYDYKKRFNGLECYDWRGNWRDYKRNDIIR